MGEGLTWAAYKGYYSLKQGWKIWIRELVLQAVHMRSLWKSKWERTKHQLQTHLMSLHTLALAVRDRLHVGRQRLCLRLGDASSQILSWMGNLYMEWWYTIYNEPPRIRAYLLTLWQYLMATSSTENGVDDYAFLDRRTATRRTRRVLGSSRLVLLFLCGLKLLHDVQRLRDPGQAMLRSSMYVEENNASGSILMEPGWQKWLCEVVKGMDVWGAKRQD